jgi:hypothetical protein
MNKYEKWYKSITDSAKYRIAEDYKEKHHILPKSLGGSDSVTNLVYLTAREHFICHWLLTKIYSEGEEHWKMINAFRMMRAENPKQKRYATKITARVYSNLKEEYSKLQSQRYFGEKNPMYGDKFYRSEEGYRRHKEAISGDKNASKRPETKKKITESKIGKKRDSFDDTWRLNLSKAASGENNGMYGKTHSDETKQKQRERAIGRKQSDETKQKKADAIRGLKREKKLCPHCNQLVAVNGYARWHGDNCRMR